MQWTRLSLWNLFSTKSSLLPYQTRPLWRARWEIGWKQVPRTSGLGYVTAEPELEGEALEEEAPSPPLVPTRQRKPTQRGREPATASGRKPTVATLAGSIEQLLQANVGISKQLESLTVRQQQLEKQRQQPLVPPPLPSHQSVLSQPLSSVLTVSSGWKFGSGPVGQTQWI